MGQVESSRGNSSFTSATRERLSSSDCLASLTTTAVNWLCVEVVDLKYLGRPASRGLDAVRNTCSDLARRVVRHSVFVEIASGRADRRQKEAVARTTAAEAPEGGRADFGRQQLLLRVEEPGGHHNRSGVFLSSALLGESAGSLLITVWKERPGFRGNALLGECTLGLGPADFSGLSREIVRPVMRRGYDRGQLKLRLGARPSPSAQSVMANVGRHSLAEVVKALAEFLIAGDGLEVVESALPAALLRRGSSRGLSKEARQELQLLLRSLRAQASVLPDDGDDQEVMQRLARLSQSMQRYVAGLLRGRPTQEEEPTVEEVEEVTAEWIREVMLKCLMRTEGLKHSCPVVREERMRHFLQVGRQFPDLSEVVALDSSGEMVPDWQGWLETAIPRSCSLSSGSQGCVWRAMDRRRGTRLAVKTAEDKHGGQMPVDSREREIIDHILMAPHPCLVQLFGVFYQSSITIIVMELAEQGDLQQVVRRHHDGYLYNLPDKANRWFGQVFLGLEHLHHSLGVLMRDLKPKNVVVTESGVAKLTDYGHSRIGLASSGGFTLHNAPPGTPEYAAPEVVMRKPYGPSADLYSLGVLLWVLLTGGLKASPGNPPCVSARLMVAGDFSYLAQNSAFLKKHIMEPERYRCRPLPCAESTDLVLRLTQMNSKFRPTHMEIRTHTFMRPLQLPAAEASCQAVARWCRGEQPSPRLAGGRSQDMAASGPSAGGGVPRDLLVSVNSLMPVPEELPRSGASTDRLLAVG